ncbi:peptidase inhibitor family I36 protein [Streptomyces alanosinicus]|uniref:peptidase inhibitor family I36 protein n=1 Tax=Streptomyces alanosinicus TaxID=68171 RepID=UPI003570EF11
MAMKRRVITALLASIASGVLLTSTTNSAYAAPPREPSCSSNMCSWPKANYKGAETWSGLHQGTCYFDGRVRSLVNKKRYNVRYYPDKNCASSLHFDSPWGYYDIEAQTGWPVWSYKRIS